MAYPEPVSIFGRKAIKAGPIRFTLSKSGITQSMGTRRPRVSLNGKGRVRRSVNLGHGIRWTK